MATASPIKAPTPAKPTVTAEEQVQVAGVSRREFLYYIWGASIAMLLGQLGAGIVWFALPRFREGEFGGVFVFNPGDIPQAGASPVSIPAGRFHVSNTDNGLVALYGVCTHLGCLPKWEPGTVRFQCPCHGSQFNLNGTYIAGPAPRGLDRFVLTVRFADGRTVSNAVDGEPIPLEGDVVDILIDTGARVNGPPPGVV